MTASVDTRQASVFRVRLSAVEVRLKLRAAMALTPFFSDLAASRARRYLNERIDPDKALMCAVALGKRDFAMDVLLDRIEANAVKGR